MPTPWTYPTTASQYTDADIHIPWLHTNEDFTEIDLGSKVYEINQLRSAEDLLHISNTLVQDIRMKTYYLVLTGFNWRNLPTTITGIEAQINVRRTGRITDDIVHLYHETPIGDNQATLDLSNNKTYGSADSTWGATSLTPEMLTNPAFGIVLRYQSHPDWPHKVTPNMEHVQLRVW